MNPQLKVFIYGMSCFLLGVLAVLFNQYYNMAIGFLIGLTSSKIRSWITK